MYSHTIFYTLKIIALISEKEAGQSRRKKSA